MMVISDVMISKDKCHFIGSGTTLKVAAEAMSKGRFSSLVVVDSEEEKTQEAGEKFISKVETIPAKTIWKGEPLGLVTKTDLCNAITRGLDMKTTPVDACMWKDVARIHAKATKSDAAEAFVKANCHHLFVCDQKGHMIGTISAWDLAREVAREAKAWVFDSTYQLGHADIIQDDVHVAGLM